MCDGISSSHDLSFLGPSIEMPDMKNDDIEIIGEFIANPKKAKRRNNHHNMDLCGEIPTKERNTRLQSMESNKHSCCNVNKKVNDLIARIAHLETKLTRLGHLDYKQGLDLSTRKTNKDLDILRQALGSLSFALKLSLHHTRVRKETKPSLKSKDTQAKTIFDTKSNIAQCVKVPDSGE